MTERWKNYGTIVLGGLLLMLFAFYDRYPILNADTGTYIYSGFDLIAPKDRPIFFGLFVRLSSLGVSLWFTVFFQCLIVAYAIVRFARRLVAGISQLQLLALLGFVSVFTIGGWFASQVMADVFVAVMILSITNYLLFENSRAEKAGLIALILLSVITHNSNFVVITLFAVLLLAASFLVKPIKKLRAKLGVLFIISIVSWLALCISNLASGNGFTTSPSTHVFLMGRLSESGFLKTYLDEKCPTNNYSLCPYRDSLPSVAWGFVWDGKSPIYKTGGWEANKVEYNNMLHDIVTTPRYYPTLIQQSAKATAEQLGYMEIDGSYALPWVRFEGGTSVYEAVKTHFPNEIKAVDTSRLNDKTIDIPFLTKLYAIVLIAVAVIAILLAIIYRPGTQVYAVFLVFAILIVLNAFATATLANVNSRMSSRVIWLLPMLCLIAIFQAYLSRQKNSKLL